MIMEMRIPGIARFGQTSGGRNVERIVLAGGGLTAAFLTRGATLQGLWLDGVAHSLTVGLESVAAYEASGAYPGVIAGPVANRISGARAVVGGKDCRLEVNEGTGTNLHSGPSGVHARVWTLAELLSDTVTFTLDLADGEGGLPGARRLSARYSLTGSGALQLDLSAMTTAPTLMNMANHSYWNLDGSKQWLGHRLQITADHWLPVDDRLIPTGEIRAVSGDMDFRHPRLLRAGAPGLDTNFCVAKARRAVTPVAELTGLGGVSMTLSTTEPGLQVYDGRGPIVAGGTPYQGLAMEPQGWPDAPNQTGFPSILLEPGETYSQTSIWTFRNNP
jgi:aldose 1-epimerase